MKGAIEVTLRKIVRLDNLFSKGFGGLECL